MKKFFILMIMFSSPLWAQTSNSDEYFKHLRFNISTSSSLEKSEQGLDFSKTLISGDFNFLLSEFKFSTNLDKQNFGFCVKTDNILKKFPCHLKYGNLSVSGSYSKLNNPLLSAPSSPFSVFSTTAQNVTASLPSASSFSKPETLFTQLSYADSKKTLQCVKANLYYNPSSSELVVSSLAKISFPKKITLNTSLTTGSFLLEENTFSSWFTTDDFYYHQQKIFCINAAFSLSSRKWGTLFSSSFYESPFGNYNFVLKTDHFAKFLHSTISLSFLYCPQKIITGSQKNISPCFQFVSGYIYQTRCATNFPLFIKTGIKIFGDFDFLKAENDFRFTSGIQLSSDLTSLALSVLLNTKIKSDFVLQSTFNNANLQLTNIWYLKKVTTTLKTSFMVNPSSDFSYIDFNQKYYLGLNFNKLFSFSSAFNVTFRDSTLIKMSENSTFQLQIHKNRLKYTLKLNLEWQQDS